MSCIIHRISLFVFTNLCMILCTCIAAVVEIRAALRLVMVWPSILLQSARVRVATAAETVTVSRLWSAMSVKQRK